MKNRENRDLPAIDVELARLELGAERERILRDSLTAGTVWDLATIDDLRRRTSLSRSHLFKLRKRFQQAAEVAALAPQSPGPRRGHRRLAADLEKACISGLKEILKRHPKIPNAAVVRLTREHIGSQRDKFGIGDAPLPSDRTFLRLIPAAITAPVIRARTHPSRRTEGELHPNMYAATGPLEIVQFDHTLADVQLVERVLRLTVGRPWVTFFVDVYTRVILGYYLTFADPSALSVGRALVRAVLPKDRLIARHGLSIDYNMFGLMEKASYDAARAHRSRPFQAGLVASGIEPFPRPPGTPHYGGHIERLIGTMVGKTKLLPGATFSNIREKGDNDSVGAACLDIDEYEKVLLIDIAEYHNTPHRALNRMTPQRAWEKAWAGRSVGPRLPKDWVAFERRFLPFETRVVTSRGVQINTNFYSALILGPMIGKVVKVHPISEDVSWVLIQIDEQFFEAACNDQSVPQVSVWEYNEARAAERAANEGEVDSAKLVELIQVRRAVTERARRRSSKARREQERERERSDIALVSPARLALGASDGSNVIPLPSHQQARRRLASVDTDAPVRQAAHADDEGGLYHVERL